MKIVTINVIFFRMQAVQNLGLGSVILIAGVIMEKHGYLILEIVFEGLLCISLFCGIVIKINLGLAITKLINGNESYSDSNN